MHFVLPPDKGNVHHSQQRVIELTKLVGSGREIADTMSNAVVNGLAGAGGGIIAQIITYPLQTVSLFTLASVDTRISDLGYFICLIATNSYRQKAAELVPAFQ